MKPAILPSQSAELWRWIRHFGDFVDPSAGDPDLRRAGRHLSLPLVVAGMAAWTLVEYLVHNLPSTTLFPWGDACISFIMTIRATRTRRDRASARRSGITVWTRGPGTADMEDGSANFAGLLSGYLVFIAIHYAVHRWTIEPGSWRYSTKIRHLTIMASRTAILA